jgi:putative chitinase
VRDEESLDELIASRMRTWYATHGGYMITPAQLMSILEIPEARADVWFPHVDAAMAQFEVSTPLRVAHFLAQVGHESGGFKYVKEIWTNSPAQQSYEGAERLGNTEPGDGERFMGRGLVQITGRRNYAALGAALNVDFVAQPQLLERLDYAALSAGWFWAVGAGLGLSRHALEASKRHGLGVGLTLNALADLDDIETITLCINGGLNGFEQRSAILMRAINVLGINTQTGGNITWSRS